MNLSSHTLNTPRSSVSSWCGACALAGLMLAALMWVTDTPMLFRPQATQQLARRAALIVRDKELAFSQYGTKLFALPTLRPVYHRVYYFTQYSREDKRKTFLRALHHSLRAYQEVDLFFITHGTSRFRRWVRTVPPHLRRRLRLVYSTGCGSARYAWSWRVMGARTYVAHPDGLSISPIFAFHFMRLWSRGRRLKEAVKEANRITKKKLFFAASLSFGLLDGEALWSHTKAKIFGAPTLDISKPLSSPTHNPLDKRGHWAP